MIFEKQQTNQLSINLYTITNNFLHGKYPRHIMLSYKPSKKPDKEVS